MRSGGRTERTNVPSFESRRASALGDYRDRGFGILPGSLPRWHVEALLEESERLWRVFEPRGPADVRIGIRVDASGRVMFDRLDPVTDVSPVFSEVNDDPAIRSLAEDGLAAAVIAMKEKLIYKRPDTPGFGLHRDGDYNTPKTGVPGSEMMTVCIALDPVTPENGPVEFFPELRHIATPAPPGEARDVDESAVRGLEPMCPELSPGDAVLFDALVPHRSARNVSGRSRRLYMVTYVPARHSRARELYYAARFREHAAMRAALRI